MRLGVLLAVIIAVLAATPTCGSNPQCTGTGSAPGCSGNGSNGGQGPTPAPSALILTHIPNVSPVGAYIAGTGGTVTQAQIRANISIALNEGVGNGAGRAISVCDPQPTTCQGGTYTDISRADASTAAGLGTAMLADPNYTEGCGTANAWLLHSSCGPAVRITPLSCGSPPNCVYNNNFSSSATAAWFKQCITGTVSGLNTSAATCNTKSPSGGSGDTGGNQSLDKGDIIFYDTPAISMINLTKNNGSSSQEIGVDPALYNAEQTWFTAANQHASGQTYKVWVNGNDRDANKSTSAGSGHSCHYTPNGTVGGAASSDCLALDSLSGVQYGGFEFFCQNTVSSHNQFAAEYCPFGINSATNVISAGKVWIPTSECEYAVNTGCNNGSAVNVTAAHMMLYDAAFLLTYNPSANQSEFSSMDFDPHSSSAQSNASGFLDSWPVQTIVPTGTVGIPITNYVQGGAGYAGCGTADNPPEASNSGGIIPYLVSGSCGYGDDTVTPVGVYCNGNTAFSVAGGANVGAIEYCINLTNATYNSSLCARILSDTGGAVLVHQVDIGQLGGTNCSGIACVLGDVLNGGTMSTQTASFACATPALPSDSGAIYTP